MLSPCDAAYRERESDDGGELQEAYSPLICIAMRAARGYHEAVLCRFPGAR